MAAVKLERDLFSYPHAPGHRHRATSREAAAEIAGRASILRERVFALVRDQGPMAEFEITAALGLPRWNVQPRVSELRAQMRLVATGERRRNPQTQKNCDVLRAVTNA